MVYRLKKSLYGLKQVLRECFKHFHGFLINIGFGQSAAYPTVYTKRNKNEFVILIVYADDNIKIHNKPMIDSLLSYFGMENCTLSDTPLPIGL